MLVPVCKSCRFLLSTSDGAHTQKIKTIKVSENKVKHKDSFLLVSMSFTGEKQITRWSPELAVCSNGSIAGAQRFPQTSMLFYMTKTKCITIEKYHKNRFISHWSPRSRVLFKIFSKSLSSARQHDASFVRHLYLVIFSLYLFCATAHSSFCMNLANCDHLRASKLYQLNLNIFLSFCPALQTVCSNANGTFFFFLIKQRLFPAFFLLPKNGQCRFPLCM